MENKIVVVAKGILLRQGKALIVKRADNDDIGGGTWEFAGGNLQFGESPEAALQREYREETGLAVKIEKLLYVTSFQTNPHRQVVLITYLCSCDDCSTLQLSPEHSACQWADSATLQRCLAKGIAEDIGKYRLWEIFS